MDPGERVGGGRLGRSHVAGLGAAYFVLVEDVAVGEGEGQEGESWSGDVGEGSAGSEVDLGKAGGGRN